MMRSSDGALDVLFLLCGAPDAPVCDPERAAERVAPEEIWPGDDFARRYTHAFAVRDGAVFAAHAVARPTATVEGLQVFAVGAATRPEYQRQGLGRQVVSALLRQIDLEGGAALWNCDARNTASVRLARTVGFTEYLWNLRWRIP